jgi:hypothetical protein
MERISNERREPASPTGADEDVSGEEERKGTLFNPEAFFGRPAFDCSN